MDRYELKQRTKAFAHACVKLANSLPGTKLGNHIQGQLIRCSSSVAVNYRAVLLAQSDAAFSAKLSIVIEEVDESDFWMEFAKDENLISESETISLMKEAKELTAIFIASRKTIQQKNKK
ncbi:four helix bundle protein [Gaoshiqia sp. Z1-71]|uniref:four helix bundle protein n=1 Tax=Gaoshiqia hydrogeniformans TaxID=3290090 RepID=UPI003BF7D3C9